MNPELEGSICSSEAARLLPWYVVGRLSMVETERVARHLEHCAICRGDLLRESAVRALLKADVPIEYAPQAGLARTLSRIDEWGGDDLVSAPQEQAAQERAAQERAAQEQAAQEQAAQEQAAQERAARELARGVAPPPRHGAVLWLTAAVVLQALGLGWFGLYGPPGTLSRPHATPAAGVTGYETLSSERPAASGPLIRAVFAPNLTVADLRLLLGAARLVVVGGPSESGAFTLRYTDNPASLATTLSALRGDARVLFAEPAVNDSMGPP
jgi:type II secretory pathway pseudopilin PulG